MVAKTEQISKVSGVGIMMIIVGIIGMGFFGWQFSEAFSATKSMQTAATDMSKLESRSGTSVAEAYYDDHGDYLLGEAKVYEKILMGVDVMGFLVSLLVAGYGGSRKTLVEAITGNLNYAPSQATKKVTSKKASKTLLDELREDELL